MPILKATPKTLVNGIRDLSRRPIPREPEFLPQHLPIIFLLTERGPSTPEVCGGDSFNQLFGSESTNWRSKFITHQTVLFDHINREGNLCAIQRIIPPNATKSMLRLSAEVIPALVPLWERNADGSIKLNANGEPIQETYPVGHVSEGMDVYVVGHRIIWHVGTADYPASIVVGGTTVYPRTFGNGTVLADFRLGSVTVSGEQLSTLLVSTGPNIPVKSTLYPILDMEVTHVGEYGNRVGLRLSAPNSKSASVGDVSAMNILGSYLYRFTCFERAAKNSSSFLQETITGESNIDLGFKNNIFHPQTNLELGFNQRFVNAYQSISNDGFVPLYGPFGRTKLYEDNLLAILQLLATTGVAVNGTETTIPEASYDSTALPYGRTPDIAFTGKPQNLQLLNIFTGVDQNNVPYWTFDVSKSVKFGGVFFGENNIHYASGGSDGLVNDIYGQPNLLKNLEIFDNGVGNICETFGDGPVKYLDVAKYPFGVIWDSGFSTNTKRKLTIPMARRKDIFTFTATQAVADYDDPSVPLTAEWKYKPAMNTSAEETSIATTLRGIILGTPESFIDGTPACRAAIVGRAGYLINHEYKGFLPLTIDVAAKVARYMGAANGRWTPGASFDSEERNIVSVFENINITYQNEATYDTEWANGLIWVQNYDRRSQFYPAFQSAYPDDTSVLNSIVTVLACCELERVGQATWRFFSGRSDLTNEQLIDASNRKVTELTEGRFDNRFVIVPDTFLTAADEQRGYSWGLNINIYANNMKSVMSLTVVAHRLEDLAQ